MWSSWFKSNWIDFFNRNFSNNNTWWTNNFLFRRFSKSSNFVWRKLFMVDRCDNIKHLCCFYRNLFCFSYRCRWLFWHSFSNCHCKSKPNCFNYFCRRFNYFLSRWKCCPKWEFNKWNMECWWWNNCNFNCNNFRRLFCDNFKFLRKCSI